VLRNERIDKINLKKFIVSVNDYYRKKQERTLNLIGIVSAECNILCVNEYILCLTQNRPTSREWITSISRNTRTSGGMLDNDTLRVGTARPRTWIPAPLILACFIAGTLFVQHTLRTAVWWPTDIVWSTRACSSSTSHPANWIWSARRRHTRIPLLFFNDYWLYRTKTCITTPSTPTKIKQLQYFNHAYLVLLHSVQKDHQQAPLDMSR